MTPVGVDYELFQNVIKTMNTDMSLKIILDDICMYSLILEKL